MKVFFQHCRPSFSNCYILGAEESPGEALIIDPGGIDSQTLHFIEDYNYTPVGIFVTSDQDDHTKGIRTLKKIYDVEIYAINTEIADFKTRPVKDGERVQAGSFTVDVVALPGHSPDSAVYCIGGFLFTGDSLSAGLIGTTTNSYGAALERTALRGKILSLPGNFVILPGRGPPTSLAAERRFNAGLAEAF